MADLAACYFCGTALDEPLGEQPVVPEALRGAGETPTVTLCPACAEKLSRVTETIVEAVEAGAAGGEPDGGEESSSGDSAASEPPSGAGTEDPADGRAGQAERPDAEPVADQGERSVVEGEHDVSALEYNKVMRLLQNREFPVDRQEIVTVAASAYEVSRRDCDRVIDVAIDRGLIEEAEGKLVRPE